MRTTKIVLHHFGGTQADPRASTQGLTEDHIERAHAARWQGFRSKLTGTHHGYSVIVYKDNWKQYRYIGEETAGAKGHNFDAVHISLAGNFMKGVDTPTRFQLETQAALIRCLVEGKPEAMGLKVLPGATVSISALDVGPHRLYAPKGYTQCNGDYFDDGFGRRVALDHLARVHGSVPWLSLALKKLSDSFKPKPLGGSDRDDEGIL